MYQMLKKFRRCSGPHEPLFRYGLELNDYGKKIGKNIKSEMCFFVHHSRMHKIKKKKNTYSRHFFGSLYNGRVLGYIDLGH